MPSISLLSVISEQNHRVMILGEEDSPLTDDTLSSLDKLQCINCGDIRYQGRRVDVCSHVICGYCQLKKNIVSNCEHCSGNIDGKQLSEYTIEEDGLLNSLYVLCPYEMCEVASLQLFELDQHIEEEHNASVDISPPVTLPEELPIR